MQRPGSRPKGAPHAGPTAFTGVMSAAPLSIEAPSAYYEQPGDYVGPPVPDDFICPVSMEIMSDPVLASDGIHYEYRTIQKWSMVSHTSPCTRARLYDYVVRDFQLRRRIAVWVQEHSSREFTSVGWLADPDRSATYQQRMDTVARTARDCVREATAGARRMRQAHDAARASVQQDAVVRDGRATLTQFLHEEVGRIDHAVGPFGLPQPNFPMDRIGTGGRALRKVRLRQLKKSMINMTQRQVTRAIDAFHRPELGKDYNIADRRESLLVLLGLMNESD